MGKCNCKKCRHQRYEAAEDRGMECAPECEKEFDCGTDRQIIRHRHVVKHRHDIVNEYDVIHEHEYNYYNVVKTREVVRRNDCEPYNPNYCGDCCCE